MLCITFLRDVTMLSEMREQMSVQKELLEAFQQLSTAGDAQELSRKTPKLFTSSAMIKLYGEVNTIAETDATVLLLGETGVGKDVIARRIHALSLRKNKTFIKVDCGSIPENLIETELFGYAAGTVFPARARRARSASSKRRRAARCSSTKSGSCPCPCRRGCSGSFRTGRSCAWVPPRRSRSTSASSPPPTRISNAPSRAGNSAVISITGSRWR